MLGLVATEIRRASPNIPHPFDTLPGAGILIPVIKSPNQEMTVSEGDLPRKWPSREALHGHTLHSSLCAFLLQQALQWVLGDINKWYHPILSPWKCIA